jgi:hypothetical protein
VSQQDPSRADGPAEYAFEATLFVSASDPGMATLLAERVAAVVNQPYRWDLEGEEDPEPVDVTLRIDSEPTEGGR